MESIDRNLHNAIHNEMAKVDPDTIFKPRISVFAEVEPRIGTEISGTILDVGSGSGYASIWLAKHRGIEKAYAMEDSEAAVNTLLPKNILHHGVQEKVEPLRGSFDSIPFQQSIDFVVAFGAIHHSKCLYSTMRSIGNSLKVGGYLIAQEPVMPNDTTNQQYREKYDLVEEMHGLRIRNGDRDDHFFREAEYIAAASFAGLDLISYTDFDSKSSMGIFARTIEFCDRVKESGPRGVAKKISRILSFSPSYQDDGAKLMKKYTKTVSPKTFLFKKGPVDYIPHLWRGLVIEN